MFQPPDDGHRHDRTECDLSDVLGTSVRPDDGLLGELEDTLGGSWTRLPADSGVFIAGQPAVPTDSGGVGAFAPVLRPVPTLTDIVLGPGRGTGTATRVAASSTVTGRHEVWQQLLRGAPVVGAVYGVHEGLDGGLALTGRPLEDLVARDPGRAPVVDVAECQEAMRAALDLPADAEFEAELVVFPLDGAAVWAVKGECTLAEPNADLRVFLRADDLSLLVSYDVACSADYAEGTAYRDNPMRSDQPVPVVLRELSPLTPPYLSGSVLHVEPRRGRRVSSASGDYRVPPSSRKFNQVSAYYHARRALRWFAEILGPDLLRHPPFTPLSLVTDDPSVRPGQVAVFQPTHGVIAFDRAARNGARSADIVIHEVAHAVADGVCRLSRSAGGQARALGEGYADYAACSALGDPRFGDYVKNDPRGARNCGDAGVRFPPGFSGPSEPYSTGAAWAAVLWDIRDALGPDVTDVVAFNSLSYLDPNCTVTQAVSALLQVDGILFPGVGGRGRHGDEIEARYQGRLP